MAAVTDGLVLDASSESITVMAEVYVNRIEDADLRILCTELIVMQCSIRYLRLVLLAATSAPTLAA